MFRVCAHHSSGDTSLGAHLSRLRFSLRSPFSLDAHPLCVRLCLGRPFSLCTHRLCLRLRRSASRFYLMHISCVCPCACVARFHLTHLCLVRVTRFSFAHTSYACACVVPIHLTHVSRVLHRVCGTPTIASRLVWKCSSVLCQDIYHPLHSRFHQVRSYDRNIAVNVWWTHKADFVPRQCDMAPGQTLDNFKFPAQEGGGAGGEGRDRDIL